KRGEELLKAKEVKTANQPLLEDKALQKGIEQGLGGVKTEIDISVEEDLFKTYRKVGAYEVSTKGLKRFGESFFQEATVRVITQRKDIPVPEEYVIGPGDEVKVTMWGRVNAQYNLVVDRDGNIAIPQLGPMRVAGMTFRDMAVHLIEQTKQIVGANVDITMGALKSIPIFVLGDVRRPGAYMVGPFATITDALLFAGGPNSIGSMRKIELRRNDKILITYDLYDLFIKGDKSKDMVLQAGDVVFVPVSGPLVGIAGNVRRPAIYELKDNKDLKTLIDLAGGVTPSADIQKIQVERIEKSVAHIVLDIAYKDIQKAKDFILQDGDLVKIFPVVDIDTNAVYIYGNVKRPGKYELKPLMKVSDVIKSIGDLKTDTHFDYALIKRLRIPDLTTELIPFNLGKVIFERDPSSDVILFPQDQIYIFSKWLFKDKPHVVVQGEVRKPGKYGMDENTTVKDAILMAGGVTKDAYFDEAELYRTDVKTKEVTLKRINLKEAMEGNPLHNLLLQDLDKIVVHSAWEFIGKRTVSIRGEVERPGVYQYADNMTVRDLIFASGNILPSAYLEEAELASHTIVEGKQATYTYKSVNLKKALEGDPEHNLKLNPFDVLFVRKITDWQKMEYVSVTGEVMYPGNYVIRPGERLSSVIERAGGYTENAYLRGAVFTREKTRELQQRSLDEMSKRLEAELIAASATAVGTATSPEEVQARRAQMEGIQRFLSIIREVRAMGRMTVHLAPLRLLKNSVYDIELQGGDSLYIPSKNEVINVTGAVMAQGSFVYRPDMSWKNYVEMAGGYTNYADKDNVYVIKVDGSALKLRGGKVWWNPFESRWEFTAFGEKFKELEPGDTIVVPEKLTRIAWMREIKDITQILMQMTL
ncbi:MAG: SLBB domain-containing protein, partial [Desulfatiglandales bacterium]